MTATATPTPTIQASSRVAPLDENTVLRIARGPLRSASPSVRFVPRDLRLPQL